MDGNGFLIHKTVVPITNMRDYDDLPNPFTFRSIFWAVLVIEKFDVSLFLIDLIHLKY